MPRGQPRLERSARALTSLVPWYLGADFLDSTTDTVHLLLPPVHPREAKAFDVLLGPTEVWERMSVRIHRRLQGRPGRETAVLVEFVGRRDRAERERELPRKDDSALWRGRAARAHRPFGRVIAL